MEQYKINAIRWLKEVGITDKRMRVNKSTAPTPEAIIGYCTSRREINCHLNMYAKRYGMALPSWLTGEIPDCGS